LYNNEVISINLVNLIGKNVFHVNDISIS